MPDGTLPGGGDASGRRGADGTRGHHDWHSVTYVREWVEANEARLEARLPLFDLLADLIPSPSTGAISILDVGAGWGPVTRHLLARFPAARAVLFDYSEAMLAEAKARLAALDGRVQYVLGDLSQPGCLHAAVAANGGPFTAIVSSSCLHNVRPTERIPALYRELREAVAPGGCFLNLDMVGTAPLLQAVWHRARIEQVRRRRLAETGTLPSYEEIEVELQARRRGELAAAHAAPASAAPAPVGDAPAQPSFGTSGAATRTLLDHLTWLQQAGFDAVDCFWRQEQRALVGAYVQAP